jgi:signal transduction histidine kinase
MVFPPWQKRLAVGAPVIAMVVFVGILLLAMHLRRASTAQVLETHELIGLLHALRGRIVDAETGQRGYVITGDSAYLDPYRDALADVTRLRTDIALAVADDPQQAARLAELDRLIAQRFDVLARPLGARAQLGFDAARDTLMAAGGRTVMGELRRVLGAIEGRKREQLEDYLVVQEQYYRASLLVMLLGGVLIVLIALRTGSMFRGYSDQQEQAAARLRDANEKLQEQALEVELQAEELQAANEALELHRGQLEELAVELELSNTELQRTNGELEDRTREAEQANHTKTEFLTAMSHELRTPLNAIIGYVDLLQIGVHGGLTAQQQQSVERVRRNSSHLLTLINDILHFAKIRVGGITIRHQPVPLELLMNETVAVMQPMIGGKRIGFMAALPQGPVPVVGDPDRIRQILLNLVSNAVKYTNDGGQVEVVANIDGERVRIRVRDTGIGIPPEKHELIFDPFVQLQRSAGGGLSDGVGLGLAISRELARAMNGDITVESSPGTGSTFTLTLPRGG